MEKTLISEDSYTTVSELPYKLAYVFFVEMDYYQQGFGYCFENMKASSSWH